MAEAVRSVGVLYESGEWSDFKLVAELERALADGSDGQGWRVEAIDMADPGCIARALRCDLLASRVFASAATRGHGAALERMGALIPAVKAAGITMVNEGRAHAFEVSKRASSEALSAAGLRVPVTLAYGLPGELHPGALRCPCVIKPDCGGRTTHTCIARSAADAAAFLGSAPPMRFIVQEYIAPERGYLTRAEVVDGEPALVVKRSVAENGLSAYRFGCTYAPYPDCPDSVLDGIRRAAYALGFTLGSFDVIETQRGAFFIDANSVSNVSEDCTELLGVDLMRTHAQAIARRAQALTPKGGNASQGRRARPPDPARRAPAGHNETADDESGR